MRFQCSSTSRNSQNLILSSRCGGRGAFSALLRAEIPKMSRMAGARCAWVTFSALLRAEIPKIGVTFGCSRVRYMLSVLFYEPKFPKFGLYVLRSATLPPFSALLRAEIPKMNLQRVIVNVPSPFSALLRAEIPKINDVKHRLLRSNTFSALLRAEIPKIASGSDPYTSIVTFSALLRAEIPKIRSPPLVVLLPTRPFQCSSTSRNSQNLQHLLDVRSKNRIFQCSSTSRNSQNTRRSRL